MKKLCTFTLFFCVFIFNNLEAQNFKFIKYKTLEINPSTSLWDLSIPLNYTEKMFIDTTYPVLISYLGVFRENFSAYYKNGEIVMDNPNFFLRKGSDYYFQAVFYSKAGSPLFTDIFIFYAPGYKSNATYFINNWDLKVVAEVVPPKGLYPSKESYFSTVPSISDSIIYGKFQDFEAMLNMVKKETGGYEYKGMVELLKTNNKKLLTFVSVLENSDGLPLLYDIEVSFLMTNVKYVITHNLTGEGAFVPYLADNIMRDGNILDQQGRIVRRLKVQSGEAIWMSYDPSGLYYLQVEGIDYAQKIIKI